MLAHISSHINYSRPLAEMQGDPRIHCLRCFETFSDSLELVVHAQSEHPEFAEVLVAALLGEGGLYAVEFLCATLANDRSFDWKRYTVEVALTPRSVVSLDSDTDVEVIILD